MTTRRVQEVLGLMQKNLECSICLELLKKPVSTRCDHLFCRFCIAEFLQTKSSVPCPLCKKPVTKRSLQEREDLSHIVDGIRDLIEAFQQDTGITFTPPRGPRSTTPFLSTPEQPITKNQKKRNVRHALPRKCLETFDVCSQDRNNASLNQNCDILSAACEHHIKQHPGEQATESDKSENGTRAKCEKSRKEQSTECNTLSKGKALRTKSGQATQHVDLDSDTEQPGCQNKEVKTSEFNETQTVVRRKVIRNKVKLRSEISFSESNTNAVSVHKQTNNELKCEGNVVETCIRTPVTRNKKIAMKNDHELQIVEEKGRTYNHETKSGISGIHDELSIKNDKLTSEKDDNINLHVPITNNKEEKRSEDSDVNPPEKHKKTRTVSRQQLQKYRTQRKKKTTLESSGSCSSAKVTAAQSAKSSADELSSVQNDRDESDLFDYIDFGEGNTAANNVVTDENDKRSDCNDFNNEAAVSKTSDEMKDKSCSNPIIVKDKYVTESRELLQEDKCSRNALVDKRIPGYNNADTECQKKNNMFVNSSRNTCPEKMSDQNIVSPMSFDDTEMPLFHSQQSFVSKQPSPDNCREIENIPETISKPKHKEDCFFDTDNDLCEFYNLDSQTEMLKFQKPKQLGKTYSNRKTGKGADNNNVIRQWIDKLPIRLKASDTVEISPLYHLQPEMEENICDSVIDSNCNANNQKSNIQTNLENENNREVNVGKRKSIFKCRHMSEEELQNHVSVENQLTVDPYEFKSSESSPKVNPKAKRRKKRNKCSTKKSDKIPLQVLENKIEINLNSDKLQKISEEFPKQSPELPGEQMEISDNEALLKFNVNKENCIQDKTILKEEEVSKKSRRQKQVHWKDYSKEMNKLVDKISDAEDHDILFSTQDAINNMTKQNDTLSSSVETSQYFDNDDDHDNCLIVRQDPVSENEGNEWETNSERGLIFNNNINRLNKSVVGLKESDQNMIIQVNETKMDKQQTNLESTPEKMDNAKVNKQKYNTDTVLKQSDKTEGRCEPETVVGRDNQIPNQDSTLKPNETCKKNVDCDYIVTKSKVKNQHHQLEVICTNTNTESHSNVFETSSELKMKSPIKCSPSSSVVAETPVLDTGVSLNNKHVTSNIADDLERAVSSSDNLLEKSGNLDEPKNPSVLYPKITPISPHIHTQNSGRNFNSRQVNKEKLADHQVSTKDESSGSNEGAQQSVQKLKEYSTCNKSEKEDLMNQNANVEHEVDVSDTESSDTEDLNATQENIEFEVPNLDIQPESVKRQLSEMSEDIRTATRRLNPVVNIPETEEFVPSCDSASAWNKHENCEDTTSVCNINIIPDSLNAKTSFQDKSNDKNKCYIKYQETKELNSQSDSQMKTSKEENKLLDMKPSAYHQSDVELADNTNSSFGKGISRDGEVDEKHSHDVSIVDSQASTLLNSDRCDFRTEMIQFSDISLAESSIIKSKEKESIGSQAFSLESGTTSASDQSTSILIPVSDTHNLNKKMPSKTNIKNCSNKQIINSTLPLAECFSTTSGNVTEKKTGSVEFQREVNNYTSPLCMSSSESQNLSTKKVKLNNNGDSQTANFEHPILRITGFSSEKFKEMVSQCPDENVKFSNNLNNSDHSANRISVQSFSDKEKIMENTDISFCRQLQPSMESSKSSAQNRKRKQNDSEMSCSAIEESSEKGQNVKEVKLVSTPVHLINSLSRFEQISSDPIPVVRHDSDDVVLHVRRSKRRCFSLDGSPVKASPYSHISKRFRNEKMAGYRKSPEKFKHTDDIVEGKSARESSQLNYREDLIDEHFPNDEPKENAMVDNTEECTKGSETKHIENKDFDYTLKTKCVVAEESNITDSKTCSNHTSFISDSSSDSEPVIKRSKSQRKRTVRGIASTKKSSNDVVTPESSFSLENKIRVNTPQPSLRLSNCGKIATPQSSFELRNKYESLFHTTSSEKCPTLNFSPYSRQLKSCDGSNIMLIQDSSNEYCNSSRQKIEANMLYNSKRDNSKSSEINLTAVENKNTTVAQSLSAPLAKRNLAENFDSSSRVLAEAMRHTQLEFVSPARKKSVNKSNSPQNSANNEYSSSLEQSSVTESSQVNSMDELASKNNSVHQKSPVSEKIFSTKTNTKKYKLRKHRNVKTGDSTKVDDQHDTTSKMCKQKKYTSEKDIDSLKCDQMYSTNSNTNLKQEESGVEIIKSSPADSKYYSGSKNSDIIQKESPIDVIISDSECDGNKEQTPIKQQSSDIYPVDTEYENNVKTDDFEFQNITELSASSHKTFVENAVNSEMENRVKIVDSECESDTEQAVCKQKPSVVSNVDSECRNNKLDHSECESNTKQSTSRRCIKTQQHKSEIVSVTDSSDSEEFILRDEDRIDYDPSHLYHDNQLLDLDLSDPKVIDKSQDIDQKYKAFPLTSSPNEGENRFECLKDDTSDEDESFNTTVRMKRKRCAVIDDSDDDSDISQNSNTNHSLNLTSSSAISSQSEILTTQQKELLETDCEKLKAKILAAEAKIKDMASRTPGCVMKEKQKSEQKQTGSPYSSLSVIQATCVDEKDLSLSGEENEDLFFNEDLIDPFQDQTEKQQNSNDLTDHEQISNKINSEESKNVPYGLNDELKKPVHSPDSENSLLIKDGSRREMKMDVAEQRSGDADGKCLANSQSSCSSTRKCFVATGLGRNEVLVVQQFAENSECKFYRKFNNRVTHVIVKTVDEEHKRCDRTLKYFQGIAAKCFIVSFQWVIDSREAGTLLSEDDYEITSDTVSEQVHYGPKASRTTPDKLFTGFSLTCIGVSNEMTKEDMVDLLKMCGADVADDPWELGTQKTDNRKLIIRCLDTEDSPPSLSEVDFFNSHYKHLGIVTVSREWALDSIGVYQLQPLTDYVLTQIDHELLPF